MSAACDVRPEGEEAEAEREVQRETQESEVEAGARKPVKMNDPKEPSEEEKRVHDLTHLPYRSWCKHCVGGRGTNAPHRRQEDKGDLYELHLDYAFMGDEGDAGHTITMLVAREKKTKMVMSTAVPSKSTGRFVVDRVWAFMQELGIEAQDVVVKTDQEPAIKHLVDEIGRRKGEVGGRWIKENSPVDSHASNGIVERAVRSVQGQVRVLKGALEDRWGAKITAKHMVIPWLMEYASHLLNRYEVGHDGRTAYERCKGKPAKTMGVEFGEKVLWRRKPAGGAMAKLTVLWEEGVFLGVKGRTGEFVVGDSKGVWKTRTIQRTPMTARWAPSNAELIQGVPWNTGDHDDRADGDRLEVIKLGHEDFASTNPPAAKEHFGNVPVPRRVKIAKEDLVMHGYTAKCEGCRAMMAGRPQKPHSEECRRRMEGLMKEHPKMRKAQKRMNDFLDKVGEEQQRRDDLEAAKKQKVEDSQQLALPHAGPPQPPPGAASSSTSGQLALPAGQLQLPQPGAEKRKSDLGEGGKEAPPQKGPKVEDKKGTKRTPEEMEEVEKMNVDKVDTNDEEEYSHYYNEWDDKWGDGDYVDQRTGEPLDPALARAARLEEVSYMKKIGLYDEVPIQECWDMTGKGPTSTRWVDVNKGTAEDPDVRCRLVARDFKPKGEKDREDLFAAMPPLETKKVVFQKAVRENAEARRTGQEGVKLMFIDIKKAHLYGEVPEGEHVYIELPGEAGQAGKCGKLKKWLYGMRHAASAWEKHYSDVLEGIGFSKSKVAPTVFYDPKRRIRCVVHGDDFTLSGRLRVLREVAEQLKKVYELKVRGVLGDEPGDDKEVTILNRTLRWTAEGLEYQADDRHVQEITGYFGLEDGSKGLNAAMGKEPAEEEDAAEDLQAPRDREYRALAARANYLALDRPDIQCAAKEICREMAKPTTRSLARVKRLARYLL